MKCTADHLSVVISCVSSSLQLLLHQQCYMFFNPVKIIQYTTYLPYLIGHWSFYSCHFARTLLYFADIPVHYIECKQLLRQGQQEMSCLHSPGCTISGNHGAQHLSKELTHTDRCKVNYIVAVHIGMTTLALRLTL